MLTYDRGRRPGMRVSSSLRLAAFCLSLLELVGDALGVSVFDPLLLHSGWGTLGPENGGCESIFHFVMPRFFL